MEVNKIMGADVSVVTPFYKGNRYIRRLIGCVQKSAEYTHDVEVELVLVNDSPEEPIVYSDEWCANVRIRVLNNPQNSGIQQSRVNGIRAASGKYIIMLDQDDTLKENAIKSQLEHIADADIVVANGIDENPLNYGRIYSSHRAHESAKKKELYYSVGCRIVSPGQCMIRKDAIPEIWYKNILTKNGSDDLLLWLLLFETDCKWVLNPDEIYVHVHTGENVSSDLDQMTASSMEVLEIMKKNRLVSKKNEKNFIRRFRMRKGYEGKGFLRKIIAYACYPDIAIKIIDIKRR